MNVKIRVRYTGIRSVNVKGSVRKNLLVGKKTVQYKMR